jgi:hypothetical protein
MNALVRSAGIVACVVLIAGCIPSFLPIVPDDDMEWELRHGTVTGQVVGLERAAPGPHDFLMGGDGCGGGDVAYPVQPDGSFNVPCGTGRQIVQVLDYADADHPMIVGEGVAVVLPAATVSITIQLHPPRPLRVGG